MKLLKWNLQCTTLIDLLEYYLAQGIIYSSDFYTDDTQDEDNILKEKVMNFDQSMERQVNDLTHSLKHVQIGGGTAWPGQTQVRPSQ